MSAEFEPELVAEDAGTPEFQREKKRFLAYVETFRASDGTLPLPMRLKLQHTFEVCRFVERICDGEGGVPERDWSLFLTAGLFHDVSRFEQYEKHKTFLDAASFDHGDRSAELLEEKGFLSELPERERRCVVEAVRVHNKIAIPQDFPAEFLPAARMTRDADKLAILCLLIRFFTGRCDDPTVRLDLPDTPEIRESVLSQAMRGSVRYTDLRNVNDFKLAIFGWARDLNFAASRRIAREKRIYETVRTLLPEDARVDALLKETQSVLRGEER